LCYAVLEFHGGGERSAFLCPLPLFLQYLPLANRSPFPSHSCERVRLLARSFPSLHEERFTSLLQSSDSTHFLKTAGCIPSIPSLERNATQQPPVLPIPSSLPPIPPLFIFFRTLFPSTYTTAPNNLFEIRRFHTLCRHNGGGWARQRANQILPGTAGRG